MPRWLAPEAYAANCTLARPHGRPDEPALGVTAGGARWRVVRHRVSHVPVRVSSRSGVTCDAPITVSDRQAAWDGGTGPEGTRSGAILTEWIRRLRHPIPSLARPISRACKTLKVIEALWVKSDSSIRSAPMQAVRHPPAWATLLAPWNRCRVLAGWWCFGLDPITHQGPRSTSAPLQALGDWRGPRSDGWRACDPLVEMAPVGSLRPGGHVQLLPVGPLMGSAHRSSPRSAMERNANVA